jgi:hypothetical protein
MIYSVPECEIQRGNGKRRVLLISDTTPDSLPVNGETVYNLDGDVTFADASVFRDCLAKKTYIYINSKWMEQ